METKPTRLKKNSQRLKKIGNGLEALARTMRREEWNPEPLDLQLYTVRLLHFINELRDIQGLAELIAKGE